MGPSRLAIRTSWQSGAYISVTIGNHTYPLDKFYNFQPDWFGQDIDVAFQMDGNFAQQPYNVWLDQVTLRAW